MVIIDLSDVELRSIFYMLKCNKYKTLKHI